jgi:hypothetical protein
MGQMNGNPCGLPNGNGPRVGREPGIASLQRMSPYFAEEVGTVIGADVRELIPIETRTPWPPIIAGAGCED